MKIEMVKKGLVVGIVWLVAGISVYSVAGTQQILRENNTDNTYLPSGITTSIEKNLLDPLEQLQLQQSFNAGLSLYGIVSTSGSGRAIPILIKLPHLGKIKGFFFFGVITYTGLSAMTTVWRFINMTAKEVVDVGVGPHIVVFIGIGYATYKRILFGGAGSMFGVSIVQPSITP
jgi:hypothetical protein